MQDWWWLLLRTFKFQSDSINSVTDIAKAESLAFFKFQSDSINTIAQVSLQSCFDPLNSNLILLIRDWFFGNVFPWLLPLNSNLILLIRLSIYSGCTCVIFKFQSDSINTAKIVATKVTGLPLNSNLILLILPLGPTKEYALLSLNSNLILLIRKISYVNGSGRSPLNSNLILLILLILWCQRTEKGL